MLFVAPIDFYITKVVINPDKEKIDKITGQFDEIVAKIKEDKRFETIVFGYSRFDWLFKPEHPSSQELTKMRNTLEKNGYSVTKRRRKTENGERSEGVIRWDCSAQPESIKAFIDKWNEIDGISSLNHFVLHYRSGTFGML